MPSACVSFAFIWKCVLVYSTKKNHKESHGDFSADSVVKAGGSDLMRRSSLGDVMEEQGHLLQSLGCELWL